MYEIIATQGKHANQSYDSYRGVRLDMDNKNYLLDNITNFLKDVSGIILWMSGFRLCS